MVKARECYKCGEPANSLNASTEPPGYTCEDCFRKKLRFTHMIFERRWKAKQEGQPYQIIKVNYAGE